MNYLIICKPLFQLSWLIGALPLVSLLLCLTLKQKFGLRKSTLFKNQMDIKSSLTIKGDTHKLLSQFVIKLTFCI